MVTLKLTRAMWGVFDQFNPQPYLWDLTFKKLKDEGFEAIEFCVGPHNCFASNKQLFTELRHKYGLDVIIQLHTTGYPVRNRKVKDHLDSYRELIKEAKQWDPVMINTHSGTDSWTIEEQLEFFRGCVVIEKEEGVIVTHETHRQRSLYNPWTTRDVLKGVPELKVNADLSHWVVVCERVFQSDIDPDWNDILALVADRAHLIHARVGYNQGPQVPDPSAPEFHNELSAHLDWWETIWSGMVRRGIKTIYVEPEHGPSPYLHHIPHTNVPVVDLWKVNTFVGQKVRQRFTDFKNKLNE